MGELTEISISEPKYTHLFIQGKEYEVALFINARECIEITKLDINQENTCLSYVKKLICGHIVGDAQIDIEQISEKCCLEYIDCYLQSNPNIESIYKQISVNTPAYTRFLQAHKDSWNNMLENLQPTLSYFAEMINTIHEGLTNTIQPILEDFSLVVNQFRNVYEEIIKGFTEQLSQTIELLSSIHIPQLSEEEKQQMIDRYAQWGDIGWTSTGFLSQELLDSDPTNRTDANKTARKILNKRNIQILFEHLNGLETINKSDVAELESCYNNRNYKACVLISFSMIDSKIVKSQNKDYQMRKQGNEGIERLKEKYPADTMNFYLLTASAYNLYHCLEAMFAKTVNFKPQYITINRHLVAHGMINRRILKRDAVQTMLALYNLYFLIELLDE